MQHSLTVYLLSLFHTSRLYSNHGQFSFGNWQQFYLDYSTKYITCSVALPPDKAAEEEENMYPDLLVFLQETLNKICALCLPSAQRPVGHLKCPLDHTGVQYHLHLPLDKISGENELICSVTKKPVPKKYYASLVKINCKYFLCTIHDASACTTCMSIKKL